MATLSIEEANLFAGAMANLLVFDALKLQVDTIDWEKIPQRVAEMALEDIVPNGSDLLNEYISTGSHNEVKQTAAALLDLGDKIKSVYPGTNLEKPISEMLTKVLSRRQDEIPVDIQESLSSIVDFKGEGFEV